MRVALVHDWLTGMRGGEKCLEAFLKLYPEADIYTLLMEEGTTTPAIESRVKGTSWLQRFPARQKYYRYLLPLYPSALRSIRLQGYDLVVSLSHAAVKNISVPHSTVHLSYCFTPMRYAWDQARFYFGGKTVLLQPILGLLRLWDRRGSRGVDGFVAISNFIAARIRLFYGRQSTVIYPPVDVSWIQSNLAARTGEQPYLYAGALVPYKRPHLAVQACTELGLPLVVAGHGPEEERLRKIAGPTIEFRGKVSGANLAELYSTSRALLFPGCEDFGMVPVECMAAGTPILGYGRGGLLETVRGSRFRMGQTEGVVKRGDTGVFFGGRTEFEALQELTALLSWHNDSGVGSILPEACVAQAHRFSVERFEREWNAFAQQYVSKSDPVGEREEGRRRAC